MEARRCSVIATTANPIHSWMSVPEQEKVLKAPTERKAEALHPSGLGCFDNSKASFSVWSLPGFLLKVGDLLLDKNFLHAWGQARNC